ncbi:tyrosine-type recombinase/integrase [Clostridium perfringens]|nr:tyrosine-type recombinase/integrase [Clostridium perfringens]
MDNRGEKVPGVPIKRGKKVPPKPIPERKYEQFKYRLEEISREYAERNLMLFYLAVATGYRMQDLMELTIGEINEALEEEKFIIQEKKQYREWQKYIKKNPRSNRKPPQKREAHIKPKLRKLLKEYCKNKPKSSYAFESKKGGDALTAKSYSQILSRVAKSLGLKNISGHSLRKTYATRLYEATRNLEYVRIALGHTNIETTKKYLGLNNEVRDEAAKVADDKL